MAANQEMISAFAVYSGITDFLSKQQKRRKQHKIRKQNAFAKKMDEYVMMNSKMCKKTEDVQDKNKKKRKLNYVGSQVNTPEKNIKTKKSLANKNGISVGDNANIQNTTEKTQSTRKKIKKTLKCHRLQEKIRLKKLKKIQKKNKTNFKISPSEENFHVSNETENFLQSIIEENNQSCEKSKCDLVGKLHLEEHCEPTLISKLEEMNKLKRKKQVLQDTVSIQKSSIEAGEELFKELLAPISSTEFFKHYWEKAVLHVPGGSAASFTTLISTQQIDDFLRNEVVMFGKHIDVTSYKNGKRETHNLEGRAVPHVVWDLYNHKCSVRLLCPQAFFKNIFALNTKLQDYFGCFVGANVYLTPPNSQGFAPHYDDIEAFVLQVEGKKRWKIYSPRNKYETLPRYSSKNFNETEVGKPILEVTLNPGDLLYFPRGFIHQADTCDNVHSLHITISVYQKNSWTDLLEKVIPIALTKAAKEDVDFRRGLPLNYLRHAGISYRSVSMRKQLIKSVKEKMIKLINYLDIDSAVDMMGMQFITDALPPVLSYDEASRCVFGNGLKMKNNGHVTGNISFSGYTKVRFTKAMCHRLVKETVKSGDGPVIEEEEKEYRLYYSMDNSLVYHGEDPQFLVIPEEYISAIKMLSLNYPAFTRIDALPLSSLIEQASLVGDLWDRGLLTTEKPLTEGGVVSKSDDEVENVGKGTEFGIYDDAILNGYDLGELEESSSEIDIVHDESLLEIAVNVDNGNVPEYQPNTVNLEQTNLTDLDNEEEEEEEGLHEEYITAIDENKQYIRDDEMMNSDDDEYDDNVDDNVDVVNLVHNLSEIDDNSSSSYELGELAEDNENEEYEIGITSSSEDQENYL